MPHPMRLFAVALISIGLWAGATVPAGAAERRPAASLMLAAINHARAHDGLRAVRVSGVLERDAADYSRVMLDENRWAHAPDFRRGTGFRQVGEILGRCACGVPAIAEIVHAWLASPEHRPILLGAQYGYVGIGYAHGKIAGRSVSLWVVRFGATDRPAAPGAPGLPALPHVVAAPVLR